MVLAEESGVRMHTDREVKVTSHPESMDWKKKGGERVERDKAPGYAGVCGMVLDRRPFGVVRIKTEERIWRGRRMKATALCDKTKGFLYEFFPVFSQCFWWSFLGETTSLQFGRTVDQVSERLDECRHLSDNKRRASGPLSTRGKVLDRQLFRTSRGSTRLAQRHTRAHGHHWLPVTVSR